MKQRLAKKKHQILSKVKIISMLTCFISDYFNEIKPETFSK